MKMRMKRLVSLFLVFMMIFSLFANLTAFAAEPEEAKDTELASSISMEGQQITEEKDEEALPEEESQPEEEIELVEESESMIDALESESEELEEKEEPVEDENLPIESEEIDETKEDLEEIEETEETETEVESEDETEPQQIQISKPIAVLAQSVAPKAEMPMAESCYVSIYTGPWFQNAPFTYSFTDATGNSVRLNISGIQIHRINNRDLAYCIEPQSASKPGASYTKDDQTYAWEKKLTRDQRTAILLAMAYGYPNNTFEQFGSGDANHMKEAATQLIIWEFVSGMRDPNTYKIKDSSMANAFGFSGDHEIAGKVYEFISRALENHFTVPSFASRDASKVQPIVLTRDPATRKFTATVTDTNGVLSTFLTSENGWKMDGVEFSYSGNTMTVTANSDKISNAPLSCYGNKLQPGTASIIPLAPKKSGEQALAIPGEFDPVPVYISLEMANLGSAQITKRVDDDSSPAGFKFKLYNRDLDMSFYGKTDENGRLFATNAKFETPAVKVYEIANLSDGEYRLREVNPGRYTMSHVKISVQKDGSITPIAEYDANDITAENNGDFAVGYFRVTGLDDGGTLVIEVSNKRPSISTIATNAADGGKRIDPTANAVIVDKVTAGELFVGHTYYVRGKLMEVDENGEASDLIINDEKVIFESERVEATSDTMEFTVNFAFDATGLEGKKIVVYEYLVDNVLKEAGLPYTTAMHTDALDEDQTVIVRSPKIWTTATDGKDGDKEIEPDYSAKIIDTVSYEDLTPGQQYRLEGKLMDVESEEPFLSNGQEVVASFDFTPTKEAGSVDVEFNFDASKMSGPVVVFEKLYSGDQLIAKHESITDPDQTLDLKDIIFGTTAFFGQGEKECDPFGIVELKDTVHYEGLSIGTTYTIKGILMDKETGKPILIDGKEITAETTLTPEESNGEAEVVFSFDATGLFGKTIVVFEDLYKDDLLLKTHADIDDADQTVRFKNPELRTTAQGEAEEKVFDPLEEIKLIDTVTYQNLTPGKTYKLVGQLMDKETKQPFGAAVEKEFTPEEENGTVEMEFTFNGSEVKGKDLVVFETVMIDEKEYISHADYEDKDQTVHITNPELRTTASNKEDGSKVIDPLEEVTIVDTVLYKDLIIGKTYTIEGILMNKATGEPLIVDEKQITASVTFEADKSEGSIDMEFTFPASALRGQTVVVFESLKRDDIEIATHSDLNDEDQTVEFTEPKIRTKAVNGEDQTQIADPMKEITIVDTVSYENLIPGKTYRVSGILMDREAKAPLMIDGETVVAEATFVPEESSGTVEVKFTFKALELKGKYIVVFEKLFRDDQELANHEDLEDDWQTIPFTDIEIGTKAKNKEDNTNTIDPIPDVVIVDTVSYTGLIVNKTYTVTGVLMNKETGKPILVDGKEVTSEVEFIAKESTGSIDVEFHFSAVGLNGTEIVVFEGLYRDDVLLAVHADLEDENQTIIVNKPSIKTKATFSSGSKTYTINPNGKNAVTVIDTITYTGLQIGKTYKVVGVLMNPATSKPLEINGKVLTVEKSFVPEKADGSVSIEYSFDASSFANGTKLVSYATVYCGEEEIASHKDLGDADQTVSFTKVPRTGGMSVWVYAGIAAGCIALAIALIFVLKKKKSSK